MMYHDAFSFGVYQWGCSTAAFLDQIELDDVVGNPVRRIELFHEVNGLDELHEGERRRFRPFRILIKHGQDPPEVVVDRIEPDIDEQ